MPVTWNPSDKGADVTLSNTDLTASCASGSAHAARATESKSAGKWYWEVVLDASGARIGVANASASLTAVVGGDAHGLAVSTATGNILKGGAIIDAFASAVSVGDVVSISFDADAGTVTFRKNNADAKTISGANVPTGALFPAMSGIANAAAQTVTGRFTAASQTYSPPAGFSALDSGLLDFLHTVTGGFSIGGEATVFPPPVHTVTGGFSIGGAATVTGKQAFIHTVTGGFSIGGTATVGFEASNNAVGDARIPRPQSSGTGVVTVLGTGATTLPWLRSSGEGGQQTGHITLGSLTVSGSGFLGTAGTGDASLPPFTSSGQAAVLIPAEGEASLRALKASGSGLTVSVGSSEGRIPGLRSEGTGLVGVGATSNTVTLRSLTVSGRGAVVSEGTGAVSLPNFIAEARGIVGDPAISRIIAMNAATGAITEYEAWLFNSFATFGGAVLAAGPDGIVELGGVADNAAAIDAYIETGKLDFGLDEGKRPTDFYVSGEFAGAMNLTVTGRVAGKEASHTYTINGGETDAGSRKFDLGRGFETLYLQYKLANRSGADFTIDAMTALAQRTGRRRG